MPTMKKLDAWSVDATRWSATRFALCILGTVVFVTLARLAQPNCEPCMENAPCPPCLSPASVAFASAAFVLAAAAMLILGRRLARS